MKGGRTASFYLEKSQRIKSAVQAQTQGWRQGLASRSTGWRDFNVSGQSTTGRFPCRSTCTVEGLHRGGSDGVRGVGEGRGDT